MGRAFATLICDTQPTFDRLIQKGSFCDLDLISSLVKVDEMKFIANFISEQ